MKYLTATLYTSPMLLAVLGHGYHPYGAAAGLIPIILMYLGIKQGFFPIIRQGKLDGANGRNWPLLVVMDPDASMYKAVLAQEIWESIYKTNPINLIRTRSGKGAQELEIMGHEIEVQVAVLLYGVKEHEYRQREAEAMTGYKQFRDVPAVEIAARMEKVTGKAREWVEDNQERMQ